MEYTIVSASHDMYQPSQQLEREVRAMIQEGWEPVGSVSHTVAHSFGGKFYHYMNQAMRRMPIAKVVGDDNG